MKWNWLYMLVIIICFLIITVITYGYNSGSCQIDKEYICDDNFCLHKEFNINLNVYLMNNIQNMLKNLHQHYY